MKLQMRNIQILALLEISPHMTYDYLSLEGLEGLESYRGPQVQEVNAPCTSISTSGTRIENDENHLQTSNKAFLKALTIGFP